MGDHAQRDGKGPLFPGRRPLNDMDAQPDTLAAAQTVAAMHVAVNLNGPVQWGSALNAWANVRPQQSVQHTAQRGIR